MKKSAILKPALLLNIAMFMYMTVTAQDVGHLQLIEQFLISIENDNEITIQDLHEQGIIHLSSTNPEQTKSFDDEYAQPIFRAIRDQIKSCKAKQNKKYEILDLERGINKRGYDSNIQVPEKGDIYLLYCNNELITHFLIEADRIRAFSTINKGGSRIFVML